MTREVAASHRPQLRALLAIGALGSAAGVLSWGAPTLIPPRSLPQLGDWLAATPPDQVVTALAAGLGWLCLCWLVGGALAVVLGRMPGAIGAAGRAVGDRITPLVIRRAVEGVLGTALATGSLVTTLPAGATEAVVPAAHPAAQAIAASQPDGWPDLDRSGQARDTPAQPPASAGSAARTGGGDGATAPVTVRVGDSLWSIAGRDLGAVAPASAVAAAWPRWYAANRRAIGPDPDVLHPGQVLKPPQ